MIFHQKKFWRQNILKKLKLKNHQKIYENNMEIIFSFRIQTSKSRIKAMISKSLILKIQYLISLKKMMIFRILEGGRLIKMNSPETRIIINNFFKSKNFSPKTSSNSHLTIWQIPLLKAVDLWLSRKCHSFKSNLNWP